MNQPSFTDSSISPSPSTSAEDISRRAYEIWEREGRPEGCDLRHWLQAEQEVSRPASNGGGSTGSMDAPRYDETGAPRPSAERPPQGARAGSAAAREGKRAAPGLSGERPAAVGSGHSTGKRKSPSASAAK
jgi:hypothetical protein